ncbi:MAG TPA: 3-isopropylmalate dehydratase small subunit [Candidatus Aphodousia faecipullorum]|nr:3-isopropylmalate dehydratase small subunit [Candidatus Aphodousia faecipullorum]
MKKFTTLTAVAAPIAIDNMDTDQLMPKQFLRGIDKSGLDKGLLFNRRFNPDGSVKSDFVLNKPGFEKTQILCAGPNFGCGSSREHAVWGLMQYGIRAIIAPGFGEIFYSNCFNNGLLAAKVTEAVSREIFECLSDVHPVKLTIDIRKKEIRSCQGDVWTFAIAPRHQSMLINGLDMLETTLQQVDSIARFKMMHEERYPWMAQLPGQYRSQ